MGKPTLQSFKTYKSISQSNDSEDTMLAQVLESSALFIENYCGRTFDPDNQTTEYSAATTGKIFLNNYPIIMAQVSTSEDGGKTYTVATEYEDYFIGEDYILMNYYVEPAISHNAIKITYSGGFENGWPSDIEQAVYDLTEYFRKAEYNPKSSLGTNMVERTNKDTDITKLPDHILRVLNNYRSIV